MDPKGLFKISIDRRNHLLAALHLSNPSHNQPDTIIKGKTAEDVYHKIEELQLITRKDHAAYLGQELKKAEIALKTKKEYIQDHPLFPSSPNLKPSQDSKIEEEHIL